LIWKYTGEGGWQFVTLPKEITTKIRKFHQARETGWGRLPIEVLVGSSEWGTSLWFDKKNESYLLPIKASVRKKEKLKIGDVINVVFSVKL